MPEKILVIDDEESVVELLRILLELKGYEVIKAYRAEDGLRKAYRTQPDLVLLDIMMPDMDGFEVCRRLRADPRRAGLRIVMLSAKGRDQEVEKGLGLGADAYVTKPFSTKDLVAQIHALLAGGR